MAPYPDLIREWLTDFKSLPESGVAEYAAGIRKQSNLIKTLCNFLQTWERNSDDHFLKVVSVCHQLLEFYKSSCEDLSIFAINFFPSIVFAYLTHHENGKEATPLGTLLYSIYCLENACQDQSLKQMPTITKPSVYHNPTNASAMFGDYVCLQNDLTPLKTATPAFKSINISNRFTIMSSVMKIYADHIALMDTCSRKCLCDLCAVVASQGFPWHEQYLSGISCGKLRIPMSIDLSLVVLQSVYFIIYNGMWNEGKESVEAMKRRAQKELVPQVLLFCNAVLSSVKMEEEKLPKFPVDHDLSVHMSHTMYGLSPATSTMLDQVGSSNRRSVSRMAVTARSIRDHRWRHKSEEVSGDYTESIQTADRTTPVHQATSVQIAKIQTEPSKSDKNITSPAKILKSRLKKSSNESSQSPQSSGKVKSDKNNSPATSNSDKKLKKSQSKEENNDNKVNKQKLSKHSSLDDNTPRPSSGSNKHASGNFLKSTSNPAGAFNSANASNVEQVNDSPSRKNESHAPLLDHDTSAHDTSSDTEKLTFNERIKESIPLLIRKNSKNFKDVKSSKGTKM